MGGPVQVFTKERMLAIEAGTIVSGVVDVAGHLILTRHDGSTYDAGMVYPISATETVQGLVELATAQETKDGVDLVRAITAAGLKAVLTDIVTPQINAAIPPDASEATKGSIKLANDVETKAVINDTKAVTPLKLGSFIKEITLTGTVQTYYTGGKPKVTLDLPGSPIVDAFLPANDEDVVGGASVVLLKVGGLYTIVAVKNTEPRFLRKIPITLDSSNGWTSYIDDGVQTTNTQGGVTAYGVPSITMSSTGWVFLEGLITKTAAVTTTPQRVGWFPVEFAPLFPLIAPGLANSTATQTGFEIRTNGEIWTTVALTAGGWVSLAGMYWNRSLTYTPLTLKNSWTKFDTNVRTPGIAKDAFGLIHVAGAIKGGTNTSGISLADLPAGFTPESVERWQMSGYTSATAHAGASAYASPSTGDIVKLGPVGNYRSDLDRLVFNDAGNTNKYRSIYTLGAWVDYGGSYAGASYYRRPDGIVALRGLIKTGANGIMGILPVGARPQNTLYLPATAANANGSIRITPDGAIYVTNGDSGYTSIQALFAAGG